MNATTNQTDPKGAQLRQTLEHLTLQKMIDQLDKEDLNIKELCHLLHTCSGHKKAEAAQEKIRSTERIAILRLNKNDQSNATNPNRARQKAAGELIAPTQPGLIGDPNTNQPQQSHQDFCKNLTQAAMDVWGLDISKMCKTDKPRDEETDPSNPGDLYDIPPQYRQGATPVKGSQERYGQPKFTRKEWRKVMFRVIRENYGIHDDPIPPPPNQPANARLPLRDPRPATPPSAPASPAASSARQAPIRAPPAP